MTIKAIIIASVISLFVVLLISGYIYNTKHGIYEENENRKVLVASIVGVVLLAIIWGTPLCYFKFTATGKRAVKTQLSELNNGIQREITVYDINGKVIEQFQGHFDIEYSAERIMFDDEKGNRHIVYFKTGTVIVNEVSK